MSKNGLESFEGARVLVTGGAGFIGSHLVDKLTALGSKIHVVDNFSSPNENYNFPNEVLVDELDIREGEKLKKLVKSIKPEVIFHVAAYSRTQGSDNDKQLVYSTNINGTINLIDAVNEQITKSFIYSGSSTYYGSGSIPNRECDPPNFGTHYALSKFAGEEVLRLSALNKNVSHTVLRYFSVYGERQPEDGAYALVLGIFLRRARLGLPLEVHGNGMQRRDFVHVEDVVQANLLAALKIQLNFKIVNVGVGSNYSILDIAKAISSNIVFTKKRIGDANETLADINGLQKHLNWIPRDRLLDYIKHSINNNK